MTAKDKATCLLASVLFALKLDRLALRVIYGKGGRDGMGEVVLAKTAQKLLARQHAMGIFDGRPHNTHHWLRFWECSICGYWMILLFGSMAMNVLLAWTCFSQQGGR